MRLFSPFIFLFLIPYVAAFADERVEPGPLKPVVPNLHGHLTRPITREQFTEHVPTRLAQRNSDRQIVKENPLRSSLLCYFDASILSDSDFPHIYDFKSKYAALMEGGLDDREKEEFSHKVHWEVSRREGAYSQAGNSLEIDENGSLSGKLYYREAAKLDFSGLDGVSDEDYWDTYRKMIAESERVGFPVKMEVAEVWKSNLEHSVVLIYPVKPNYILEIRMNLDWHSPNFMGYALLVIYNEDGGIFAFDSGRCLPPMM